jgi:phosphoglycerate dehydrogenase-like enzyme
MKVLCHYSLSKDLADEIGKQCDPHLELIFCPEDDEIRFNALLPTLDVIWHVLKPITARHITQAPKLRLIQKLGVGINTIDTEAARTRGIAVCNTPGANTRSVAEMTLLLMLSSLRRLPEMLQRVRSPQEWAIPPAIQAELGELGGRTVGFVGFGAVPTMLAPWLTAMGARVVYFNRTPKPDIRYPLLPLDQLLAKSDIISLHLPLTQETARLIDAARLRLIKRGAIIINTARGAIIDESALNAALRAGVLGAAGLDVFTQEPIELGNPLFSLSNVTASPHVAWLTREALMRCLDQALSNVRRLARDEHLHNRLV